MWPIKEKENRQLLDDVVAKSYPLFARMCRYGSLINIRTSTPLLSTQKMHVKQMEFGFKLPLTFMTEMQFYQ